MLQRLKATALFEQLPPDELEKSVINFISSNATNMWKLTLQDPFLFNYISKLDEATAKLIAENLLKALLKPEKHSIQIETFSSCELLTKALIDAAFYKIDKSIRQKHGSIKCLSTEVYAMIKTYSENNGSFEVPEKLLNTGNLETIDVDEKQVTKYLGILQKLPIIHISPDFQSLFVLYLTALHIETSNKSVKKQCEILVTGLFAYYIPKSFVKSSFSGIFQSNRTVIVNYFKSTRMFKIIVANFENYEQLLKMLFESACKDENALTQLEEVVNYIKMNLKECIKCAVIFLNVISKVIAIYDAVNTVLIPLIFLVGKTNSRMQIKNFAIQKRNKSKHTRIFTCR